MIGFTQKKMVGIEMEIVIQANLFDGAIVVFCIRIESNVLIFLQCHICQCLQVFVDGVTLYVQRHDGISDSDLSDSWDRFCADRYTALSDHSENSS